METQVQQILSEQFAIADAEVRLVSRGNNAIYRVDAAGEPFALKLTKASFRPAEAYDFETALAAHWASSGSQVPTPVPAQDGQLFCTLADGRTAMLLSWLDGRSFDADLKPIDASDIGAALAQLHVAGGTFSHSFKRRISVPDMIADRKQHLSRFLEESQKDVSMFGTAIVKLEGAYAELSSNLPGGAVHGDAQYANAMRCTDGSVALFDLDTCGMGLFVDDIATFTWRAELDAIEQGLTDAFLSGYESVRTLTGAEQLFLPIARLGRDVVMACTYAWLIDSVGPVSGFDVPFSRYCALAERHLAALP